MVSRNYRKGMQFTDTIAHLYPELTERAKDAGYKKTFNTKFDIPSN